MRQLYTLRTSYVPGRTTSNSLSGSARACDCHSAYSEDEELEHEGKPTIWFELVDSHIQYGSDAPDREHVKESQHNAVAGAPSR